MCGDNNIVGHYQSITLEDLILTWSMKKKTFTILFLLLQGILLLNCKKEPVRNNSAPPSMYELITKDTLEFESYIIKWNTSSVDTFYKRRATGNSLNLDTSWLKFDKGGTYKAFLSRDYNYSASWEFLDNGSKLRLWSDGRNFDQEFTILRLSQDTVEWLNSKLDNLFYRFTYK
jgi:hypothetical protein